MAARWDSPEEERDQRTQPQARAGILAGLAGPVLSLLLYLALAILLFGSTWQHPFTRVVGDGGDALQFMWFLGWSSFALGHHLNPLFSDVINVPYGVNLMWNAAMPLPAAVLSPVTRALGPVLSYNLLITVGVALSAFTAFAALRRYVRHLSAALVGGLVYGFSPYEAAHALGHPHVALAFIPPLFLLVLDDLLLRHRHHPMMMGAALGLLGAAQLLTGEELLATTALVVILTILVWSALADGDRELPRFWRSKPLRLFSFLRLQARPMLVAAAVFLLLTAAPIAMQFLGPQRVGGQLQPRNEYVSDLLNLITPTSAQQFAPEWARQLSDNFAGAPAESTAYIGLPLLLLLAWISWRAFRPGAVADQRQKVTVTVLRLAALGLVVCSLLSLGLTLHIAGHNTLIPSALLGLPLLWVRKAFRGRLVFFTVLLTSIAVAVVPVLDNLLPARLMLFAFLAAALMVAITLDEIMARGLASSFLSFAKPASLDPRRKPITRIVAAGVVGLALLPLLPRTAFPSAEVPLPDYFISDAVRQIPENSVVLVAPFARAGHGTAMLWQAEAGMRFRMPEGYVFVPQHANLADPPASATLDELTALELGQQPSMTASLRSALVADLDRWQVAAVVVGPMPYRERVVALYTELLGATPQVQGGVAVFRR